MKFAVFLLRTFGWINVAISALELGLVVAGDPAGSITQGIFAALVAWLDFYTARNIEDNHGESGTTKTG